MLLMVLAKNNKPWLASCHQDSGPANIYQLKHCEPCGSIE